MLANDWSRHGPAAEPIAVELETNLVAVAVTLRPTGQPVAAGSGARCELKIDLLYRHSWPTCAAARSAIFEYIEGFDNRERRHIRLGNLSPADYESQHAAVCSA